ncbi:unnamed protein product [Durusdinium trenchii]|uniref:Uncharacterized protein n=1 Tax=Durusdinium trenchii TaxID=1381693 RepID=A0ABP0M078_9DINO
MFDLCRQAQECFFVYYLKRRAMSTASGPHLVPIPPTGPAPKWRFQRAQVAASSDRHVMRLPRILEEERKPSIETLLEERDARRHRRSKFHGGALEWSRQGKHAQLSRPKPGRREGTEFISHSLTDRSGSRDL